jgi:dihydrofolate synthase / folylpolyglutamate synthase
MITKAIKTKIFNKGNDLINFIAGHIKKIPEKSVIVITSKIVALSEKRTAEIKNNHTKESIIKSKSDFYIPTKYAWLTINKGAVMALAGIDESNADEKLILLPKDCFKSAKEIRQRLLKIYGLKKLGVIISDNRTAPFRPGITGVSLRHAGFKGIR